MILSCIPVGQTWTTIWVLLVGAGWAQSDGEFLYTGWSRPLTRLECKAIETEGETSPY